MVEPIAEALFESPLPAAIRQRWQPVRGGLVNLYRYDQQEFHYEQGHLLLRGNNGTGKSRVLALQLPFLLDGDTSSDRVEPDRDPAKRIEWNLLMGRHSDRMGYTWLEFGRLHPETGTQEFLTLGCGLSAVEGRGLVDKWFFITPQRIGRELKLLRAEGTVLGREALTVALEGRGQIFKTARDYRRAVDTALFRLGEQRYEALVNLLIQLRQPQLSRTLDEERLSAALGEALPPVSPQLLGDIAEAFRSLEADRQMLEDYRATAAAVETFAGHYQRYAQLAAGKRAENLRQAQSRLEAQQRQLRSLETQIHEELATQLSLQTRSAAHQIELAAAQVELRTLEESPEMRSARTLDQTAQRLAHQDQQVAQAHHDAAQMQEVTHKAQGQLEALETRIQKQRADLEGFFNQSFQAAQLCGLDDLHRRFIPQPPPETRELLEQSRPALEEHLDRLHRGVEHLRRLEAEVTRAQHELHGAVRRQSDLSEELQQMLDRRDQAHQSLQAAQQRLIFDYAHWFSTLQELHPTAPEAMGEAIAEWSQNSAGASPLQSALREALVPAQKQLAQAQAHLQQRRDLMHQELQQLQSQESQLQAGHHEPPPLRHTQSPRQDRAGAPLWRVCDFHPELPPDRRAGLEAALEASGLLDAWIAPEGQLFIDGEIYLQITSEEPAPQALSQALVPSIDPQDPMAATLNPATIGAILQRIALGQDPARKAWIDTDGSWQLGPLLGRWQKPQAVHLGHAAREDQRRRRLAQIAELIEIAQKALHELSAEAETLQQRATHLELESATLPDETPVRQSASSLELLSREAEQLQSRLLQADEKVLLARGQLGRASDIRHQDARELGLTHALADLNAWQHLLHGYQRHLERLWPAIASLHETRDRAAAAREDLHQLQQQHLQRQDRLSQARRHHAQLAAELKVLQETLGASVEKVLAQLEAVRRSVETLVAEEKHLQHRTMEISIHLARLEQDLAHQKQELETQSQERQRHFLALSALAETALAALAGPELNLAAIAPHSLTAGLDLARQIAGALESLEFSDGLWERLSNLVYRHLQELRDRLLPFGYDPVQSQIDGLIHVSVPFQGRSCSMAELPRALGAEIQQRQVILDAREREVLENHLVGEVAMHLHDRIREALRLVDHMNKELTARPTSTGMKLRFRWDPREDGPAGLESASSRLMAAGGTWSPSDRQALGEFLQRQIQAVRQADQTGSWQDHLTRALDYRSWHRFSVERHQEGIWKRLTRRTHGTGSGGEKVIALTIPQFAAAAAHYSSADPSAPRLILLDEAFVGVDNDMRSKCMGLLQAFDLDFVMTSEREWGCYSTLPGVAIYQLASRPGFQAVGVTRWLWNGKQLLRQENAAV